LTLSFSNIATVVFVHDNVLYHALRAEYTSGMKLDKDLVRDILLAVEASDHDPVVWMTLDVPGHTLQELSYHVQLLDEAGYLEAQNLSSMDGYEWQPKRLTYQGHEFLDTVRDPEMWRRTKEMATKAGVASVSALFQVGVAMTKQKLAEHGISL
jgi:hypothetical protein